MQRGIAALAGEPVFAAILERAGSPRFRRRRNGFETLLHIILEQQVSIDAAAAMFRRLHGLLGEVTPATFLTVGEADLRRCGFSRQKASYGRALAERVASGELDFARLSETADDEAAAQLISLKGIGRWSAEVYMIFALGRDDIWPAADLGLQFGVASELGVGTRIGEKELRDLGARWRPWRSTAACLFWQSYLHARKRTAPVLPAELYA
ncbi:MAG: DNA-3-methyladenine glycosylase 2 family protein [Alphaproteobacteria bacterium]|nr:DNA-3-methyladenine glycosylase 2 family protein [Alphaproteobacteria bacterium]